MKEKRGVKQSSGAFVRLVPLFLLMLVAGVIVMANSLFEPDSYLQLEAVYESSGSTLPNPASLSVPLQMELVRDADDGNVLITSGASADGQYDMQFFKMRLDAALSWDDVEDFGFTWTGHGDAVQGYPVSFHIWDFNAESWVQLGGDEYVPADSSVSRSATLTPANLDSENFLWLMVKAMHYECADVDEGCNVDEDCCGMLICGLSGTCEQPPLPNLYVTLAEPFPTEIMVGIGYSINIVMQAGNDGTADSPALSSGCDQNDPIYPQTWADGTEFGPLAHAYNNILWKWQDGTPPIFSGGYDGRVDNPLPALPAGQSPILVSSIEQQALCDGLGVAVDVMFVINSCRVQPELNYADNHLELPTVCCATPGTSCTSDDQCCTGYSCDIGGSDTCTPDGPMADLVPYLTDYPTPPATPIPIFDGYPLSIVVRTENIGTAGTSETTTTRLSGNTILFDDSTNPMFIDVNSIPSGGNYDSPPIDITCSNYDDSTHTLTLIADYGNDVFELSEDNNMLQYEIRCAPGLPPLEATHVSAGSAHTCGVRAGDDLVLCWGRNYYGQLGVGSNVDVAVPRVTYDSLAYTGISAGGSHTCGIRLSDSRVLCWGRNIEGQVGDGSLFDRWLTPVQIYGDEAYASVSAGSRHSCGIRNDGRVLCWGRNYYGQLGDGSADDKRVPTLTADASAYASVSAGGSHTCGIRDDGSVWCWGRNNLGQLGDDSTTDSSVPVQIYGADEVYTSISAGGYHTCGIRDDGSVWCWGYNGQGQLGDDSTTDSSVPVQIYGDEVYTSVSASTWHSCGIRDDGSVWCWGRNNYGQLGDGSTTDSSVPVQIYGDEVYTSISAGGSHTCGVRYDGRVLCWGRNLYGQLGDGTSGGLSLVPTLVL